MTLSPDPVKNSVTADMGLLALSISDATLFSWAKVATKYYQQVSVLDFSK